MEKLRDNGGVEAEMKKILRKLEDCVRQRAHRDTATEHFVQFLFRIFSNELTAGVTTIVGTVFIAVMASRGYYKCWFSVIAILYSLSILLTAWANSYVKRKIRDTGHFQNALKGVGQVLRAWAITMQKGATKLGRIDVKTDASGVKNILSDIDFQTAAFCVCENVSGFLSKQCQDGEVYVTVYQRMKGKDGEDYCRMIAYSQSHEPTSYREKYPIPEKEDAKLGEVELHSYIFASGKTDAVILADQKSVRKAFKLHERCENREEEIQQYIGIPIIPKNLGVTFILQVDTSVSALFGESEAAVREFSENTIIPFAQFLHMIYEQGKVIERIID